MAGRYVFTPARRAALKRAAAKSAAKRRANSANRKAAKLKKYGPRRGKRTIAQNEARIRRDSKRVRNVALGIYATAAAVSYSNARNDAIKKQYGNKANYKLHREAYKKQRAFDKKMNKATGPKARASATRKAQKSYNRAQTNINRADRRDERRSGIKRNATGKRKVKSSRVYGPGNVMVSQKALTSGRR